MVRNRAKQQPSVGDNDRESQIQAPLSPSQPGSGQADPPGASTVHAAIASTVRSVDECPYAVAAAVCRPVPPSAPAEPAADDTVRHWAAGDACVFPMHLADYW